MYVASKVFSSAYSDDARIEDLQNKINELKTIVNQLKGEL